MKNTKRSAFTIVELVIVIAVIAILSAVLIPTFGAIIKDANEAADKAAASTLTSELHVYLKGETIDSEEELMAALNDSGIGEKLVPKALSDGHHFWFDMANQMIIAGYAKDIKEMGNTDQNDQNNQNNGAAEGAALTAAVLTANTETKTYPASMRHLYGNGIFLIDHADVLNQMFGNFADITATNYANYFANVINKKEDETYGDIAIQVLANLQSTVIVNNNGVFFYTGAKEATSNTVWFAPGIEVIKANHVAYDGTNTPATVDTGIPAVSEFNLPSSVLLVEPNALNFADTTTEILVNTTVGTDYNKLTAIFGPKSTNANIVDKAGKVFKVVVVGESDNYIDDNGEAVEAGDDILVEIVEGNPVFRAYLTSKAPFESATEWEIGYELTDSIQAASKNNWLVERTEDEVDILYLNLASNVDFYIYSGNTKSHSVKAWDSSNEAVISDDLKLLDAGETTLTATVVHLDGHEDTHSIVVRVNKATSANVVINNVRYNLNSEEFDINWQYNAGNTLSPVVMTNNEGKLSLDYYYTAIATGSNNITVSLADENGSLALSENVISKVENKTADTAFTVSVDGELTTTFNVSIIDNENSPATVNFYDKTNGNTYLYYIGSSNEIKLGSLFDTVAAAGTLAGATLTVYDTIDLYGVTYEANRTGNDGFTVTFNGNKDYDNNGKPTTAWVLSTNWESDVLKFNIPENNYNEANYDVYIKITPTDGKSPYLIRVHVVHGTNVAYTESEGKDITASKVIEALANGNAILHSGFTVNTGTTFTVGTGTTLYGNGYRIDAQKYTAPILETTFVEDEVVRAAYTECSVCHKKNPSPGLIGIAKDDCYTEYNERWSPNGHGTSTWEGWNQIWTNIISYPEIKEDVTYDCSDDAEVAFISLNGGTINNIYLDGPVYPKLQYILNDCKIDGHDDHNSTPYYVSGIKASDTSTIINSYVSGFRQPVKAAGALLNITNTVLRGGNYANLQVVAGNLSLKDVTTIQDQDGIEDTINTGTKTRVTGMGIAVEDSGKGVNITVDGYLDQHNWLEKNQGAALPTVSTNYGASVNMNSIMGYMFNGTFGMKMGRFMYFIHQVEGETPIVDSAQNTSLLKEYINASIIFIDVPEEEGGTITAYDKNAGYVNINPVAPSAGNTGYTGRDYVLNGIQLSQEGLGSITLDDFLGVDATVAFYSYVDGQNWVNKTDSEGKPLTGQLFVNNQEAGYTYVSDNDLYYDGYYLTNSIYAGYYN